MKNITICEVSGFCFGVKRAVSYLETAIQKYGAKMPVYTFGPIVHNSYVVDEFSKKNVKVVEGFDDVRPGCLVIRSHGASPKVFEVALERGFEIVDATCPFVKKIHNIVKTLRDAQSPIIIIGKAEHPEVIGISGYAGKDCHIVSSNEDVKSLPYLSKAGVVVQTTKTSEEFSSISEILKETIPNCNIYNTICFETVRRQKAVASLAKKSDVMIISGGKHSSNTSKLYSIASSICHKTYILENLSELESKWLESSDNIGLASGASTPIGELFKLRDAIEDLL